jgi:hypothetical protein
MSTHTIHAALTRSTTSSLGTIVLSALILTSLRLLALLTAFLRAAPSYLPLPMRPFVHPLTIGTTMAVGWLDNVTTALSKYALVYTGLTGDPFFPSARRARALSAAIEAAPEGKYLRKFKSERALSLIFCLRIPLSDLSCCSAFDVVDHCSSDTHLSVHPHHLPVCRTYARSTRSGLGRSGTRWSCHCAGRTILCGFSEGYVSTLVDNTLIHTTR